MYIARVDPMKVFPRKEKAIVSDGLKRFMEVQNNNSILTTRLSKTQSGCLVIKHYALI